MADSDLDSRHLLVGLGNPGDRYAGNRHNIGFRVIERIHDRYRAGPWRAKFQGLFVEATIDDYRAVLLKPQTYMNESGRSVAEAVRFYKLPLSRVTIFYDELDLPPARLRVKTGGGLAGHNGLRSISPAIGNDYRRVRVGIGHPGDKAVVQRHVLSDFAKAEQAWVEDLCDACAEYCGLILAGRDALFQTRVLARMQDRGHGEQDPPQVRDQQKDTSGTGT